jgi:hypothetical protein
MEFKSKKGAGDRAKTGACGGNPGFPPAGAPSEGSALRAAVAAAVAAVAVAVIAAEAAHSVCIWAICSCICCRVASLKAAMVGSTWSVRRVLMVEALGLYCCQAMYDPNEEASWLYTSSTLAQRERVGKSCTLVVLTEIMTLTTCLVTLQFK